MVRKLFIGVLVVVLLAQLALGIVSAAREDPNDEMSTGFILVNRVNHLPPVGAVFVDSKHSFAVPAGWRISVITVEARNIYEAVRRTAIRFYEMYMYVGVDDVPFIKWVGNSEGLNTVKPPEGYYSVVVYARPLPARPETFPIFQTEDAPKIGMVIIQVGYPFEVPADWDYNVIIQDTLPFVSEDFIEETLDRFVKYAVNMGYQWNQDPTRFQFAGIWNGEITEPVLEKRLVEATLLPKVVVYKKIN